MSLNNGLERALGMLERYAEQQSFKWWQLFKYTKSWQCWSFRYKWMRDLYERIKTNASACRLFR